MALQESGIPVPHHICVNRDKLPEGQDPEGFLETEDYVEMDGALLPDTAQECCMSGIPLAVMQLKCRLDTCQDYLFHY